MRILLSLLFTSQDFIDLNDPVNDKAFRMRNYVLVTNPKYVSNII
jgi:hypothetical protein